MFGVEMGPKSFLGFTDNFIYVSFLYSDNLNSAFWGHFEAFGDLSDQIFFGAGLGPKKDFGIYSTKVITFIILLVPTFTVF